MPLTRALILRHASTRQDAYIPALLDVAQDHLLHVLELVGIFDRDDIAFKGGTSLRKCRIGHQGRFSTTSTSRCPTRMMSLMSAMRLTMRG